MIAPHETIPDTRDSTLADEPTPHVLARFNRGNAEFAASDYDGVVHIRRRDQPALIDGLMTRSSQQPEWTRPPLGLADGDGLVDDAAPFSYSLETVVSATGALLWTGAFQDEGAVGSYLGGRPPCADVRVRVAAGTTSPLRVLDAIARQHSDIFWVVTYDPEGTAFADDLRVGVVCSGGGSVFIRSGRSRRRG